MANDLKDREKLDPGQEYYDREFNDLTKNLDHDQEQENYDREFNDIAHNFDDTAPEPTLKSAEKNAGKQQPQGGETDLAKRESAGAGAVPGGGKNLYKGKQGSTEQVKGKFFTRRRTAILGGTGATLVLGGTAGIVFLQGLQPKIVSNMMMDKANKMIKADTQARFKRYIDAYFRRMLLPSVESCGRLTNTKCIDAYDRGDMPKGPIGSMYKNWQRNSMSKFLLKNGIKEITFDRQTRRYTIELAEGTAHIPSDDLKHTNFSLDDYAYGGRNRVELGSIIRYHIDTGNFSDWIRSRLLAKYLQKTFGLPLCNHFCSVRAAIEAKKLSFGDQIKKFRDAQVGLVSRRLIEPTGAFNGILFKCMMQTIDCSNKDEMRKALDEVNAAGDLGKSGEDLDALAERGAELNKRGFSTNTLYRIALEKILGKELGGQAADLIPGVNAIYMGLQAVVFLNEFARAASGQSPTIMMLANSMKETQGLGSAQMLMTMGAEESGTTDNFNTSALAADHDTLEGIEQSKLYQEEYGSASFISNPSYKSNVSCPDDEPIPDKDATCTSMRLDTRPPIRQAIHGTLLEDLLNIYVNSQRWQGADAIIVVMKGISAVFGTITDVLIKSIPFGLGEKMMQLVAQLTQKGVDALLKEIGPALQRLFEKGLGACYGSQDDAKGARFFDCASMGLDYMNYKQAKDQMGGRELSTADAQALVTYADTTDRESMRYASLGTRLFSYEDQYSLVSQLAINSPVSHISTPSSVVAMLNPINIIASSTLGFHRADAVNLQLPEQRFGVPSAGIPLGDPAITNDPWTNNTTQCDTTRTKGGLNRIVEERYTDIKGCMLDKMVTQIGNANFSADPLGGE